MPANASPITPAEPRLQNLLGIRQAVKPSVYKQVFAATEIYNLTYWLEIFFSAGIATFGLVESSPAVIIGAMLISPLMGPIMATGLSMAIGDLYLGIKAVLNLVASITVSILFSGFLVWLLPFHSTTAEVIARTNPNLLDLGIALLSGLAGSVVVCRGAAQGATALPGVAIAVALMPPLCTMGFGLGGGLNLVIMGGAGLLFLTNLVAIVATAFVIFLLVGMNTPEVERVMLASRGDEPLARLLSHSPIARILPTGGQVRWRILMMLVLLGSIAVPLGRALQQVAGETLTRSAVQDALKSIVIPDAVVSQQVSVGRDAIVIHLTSTQQIPEAKITEVRENLMRQTGHAVQFTVDEVASKSELAELMARMARPAAPVEVPKPETLEEMQKELLDRFTPAIAGIWPAADAPMQDFSILLNPSGVELDVRYTAAKDLDQISHDLILNGIRGKLGLPDLTLKLQRVSTPPKPRAAAAKSKSR